MNLAAITIASVRAELGEDGIWKSDDAAIAAACNDVMQSLPATTCRPAWAACVAAEVATQLGGKVVFLAEIEDDDDTAGPQ